MSPRDGDESKEKGGKKMDAEMRPKTSDDRVEAALRILKESSLDRTYDPINSIFINHAKERRLQLRYCTECFTDLGKLNSTMHYCLARGKLI